MASTAAKVEEVASTCTTFGDTDIIVLSGVPATGKTYISRLAAEQVAGHPGFVRRTQFHPAFSYEDLIEGLRPRPSGGYEVRSGLFLSWNIQAQKDPDNRYVFLIEEFSRADLPAVLGELLTFIEHRDEAFALPISQEPTSVAENMIILATMNPRDRSALEIDDALLRRLRIIDCPPDMDQLAEMLDSSLQGTPEEISALTSQIMGVFKACEAEFPDNYQDEMPFGHGMFADVRNPRDLRFLWDQKIKRILYRAQGLSHPFAATIRDKYPWRS